MSTQIRTKPIGWGSLALMPLALAAAVVLIIGPQPVRAQVTSDPCSVRANFDQAQAAADAADAAFKKLKEPDWSKLPKGYEKKFDPAGQDPLSMVVDRDKRVEALLKKLKDDLKKHTDALGNLTQAQAQANLTTAKAQEKALKQQYDLKLKEISKLDAALIKLGQDLAALEQNSDMPTDEKIQTIVTLQEFLQKKETEVKELVSKNDEQIDIDVAQFRVNNPTFKDFVSEEITSARRELGRAQSAGIHDEVVKAEEALNKAIEDARQKAKGALAARDATVKQLRQYQPAQDLLIQKAETEHEIEQTKMKRQDLEKQKPTVKDLTTAHNQVLEAEGQLDAAKAATKAATKPGPELEALIKSIEPWFNALRKRDEADNKLEQAKQDYGKALEAKNKLLDKDKARFDEEQARIARTQTSLKGQAKDQAYYQKLSQTTLHARATYELILLNLVDLDCFGDVRKFMDDLKQRMKKLDEARDQILKQAIAAAKAAAAKPVAVRGTFGRIGVVLGTVPGPSENNDARAYGSISATSYSVTVEAKFYEGKTTVNHTYNTPPATLKPGDIIELKCASTATISGGKNKNGALNAPYIGSSCGWYIQGKVELLKAFKRVDTETERGKVTEEYKGTFAGIGSNGIFYPTSAISVRFKVLPGTQGDTITLQAWQAGQTWGAAEEKPTWNPAEYKYKFNP
jgi:hypothetical protein